MTIDATFRKTEEAKQTERAAHKCGWRVAKYVFLSACGFALFRVGSVLAYAERGYDALGGEILLPLFPFLVCGIVSMTKDAIRDAKAYRAAGKDERTMNEHADVNTRTEAVEDAQGAILSVLSDYPADIWGDALGAVVASLLDSKRDAQEIAQEERARRELE